MALFERKRDVGSGSPLYSIGSTRTILIVGLGNEGSEYKNTRHNIGFEVMDSFAESNDFPGWLLKKDLKSQISMHTLGDARVILCKPTTMMNNSGEAVAATQKFYRIYNANTLAVYDELAVKFGSLRTRVGGNDAGHNGVKSLINYIGEDFSRLRIGIGSEIAKKADASDFVLGKFSKDEQGSLDLVIKEATAILTEYIYGGQLPHDTRTVL